MILIVPDYYKEFHCLAGECKDSCCIGWEIDIDEETYDYYRTVTGKFGDRLMEGIQADENERCFRLKNQRCFFLNEENLCEICLNLHETALCEICTEYPRVTLEYGCIREKCMALSCEEVGRLVFQHREPITLEESTILSMEEEEEHLNEEMEALKCIRDFSIKILQMREYSFRTRLKSLLQWSEQVQQWMNEERMSVIQAKQLVDSFVIDQGFTECVETKGQEYFAKRMDSFQKLEILDKEWQEIFRGMQKKFSSKSMSSMEYQALHNEVASVLKNRQWEYEHICVYFLFRYGMKAVYDYDYIGKVKLAVVSYLVIRDMDVYRYIQRDKEYQVEDRIDLTRIYSKEVEHSEENLETLAEDFVFEEIYQVSSLISQI